MVAAFRYFQQHKVLTQPKRSERRKKPVSVYMLLFYFQEFVSVLLLYFHMKEALSVYDHILFISSGKKLGSTIPGTVAGTEENANFGIQRTQ